MNIKEHIEERLWNFIKKNYNSENYTNAILDSIQFLGDLIRDKSGLESDGQSLIGSAFGGVNPKIKMNKLKTESEKNIQKGTESILRGIYSAYRNPRSHSKIEDSEENAIEIIIFINHLLKQLDKSKGKFTTELFLERVFDEDFVQTQFYSDILVKEIPKQKFFEIAIEIFRQKNNGKINNIKLVWDSINKGLSEEEKKELLDIASEELRYTDSFDTVTKCIALFKNNWTELDADSKLRAENKLIKSIEYSEKDILCRINQFGKASAWIIPIMNTTILKPSIAKSVYNSLNSRVDNRQRYVLDVFHSYFEDFDKFLTGESFNNVLKNELKNGNPIIFDFITFHYDEEGRLEFKDLIDNFVDRNDDGLPF
ncbi:TIGR02391 family protein [Cellulophaga baltica]|uniref:TIGR02391 family protein n=1 Tax=Cellulophaga baltica TaxID=76594 RepID=UPI002148D681|nr:TIGR02391 family protein [Cellulophaga baltica]MCR1026649.1 TIGR02391 family protein [Cellulophaga baltica]